MIIGVYAPKPGMGTSTLSRNLAHIASKKSKVLLVELDYFYPSSSLVFGVSDHVRNIEACVADYTEKRKNWNIMDYVLDHTNVKPHSYKWPRKLSALLPLGKKGFEYFPDEPETFVSDLITQANDVGFQDVILDMSAMIDTHFTFNALKTSDVVLCLFNNSYAVSQTFLHRIQAMKEHKMVKEYLVVTNPTRKGLHAEAVYKDIVSKQLPTVSLPFDSKQIKSEKICNVRMSHAYEKAIKRLINKLATMEKEMKRDEWGAVAYAN